VDVARLARGEIASSLRSNARFNTCLLVAGMVTTSNQPTHTTHTQPSGNYRDTTHEDSEAPSFSRRIQKQVQIAMRESASSHQTNTDAAAATNDHTSSQNQQPTPTNKNNESTQTTAPLTTRTNNNNNNNNNSIDCLQPKLYWIDEYGAIQSLEYGAHGLGANFALSILDRQYNPDLTREQAATLIDDCFQQLNTRFVINCPAPPCVKCIDRDGCRLVSTKE